MWKCQELVLTTTVISAMLPKKKKNYTDFRTINLEVLTHFRGFGLQKYVNPPSLYFSTVLIQYAELAFLKGA